MRARYKPRSFSLGKFPSAWARVPYRQSQRRQMKKICGKSKLCVLCVLCVYSNAQAKDAQGKEVGARHGRK